MTAAVKFLVDPARVAGRQQHEEEPGHYEVHGSKLPRGKEVRVASQEVHHPIHRDPQDRPERDEEGVGVGNAKVYGEVEDDRESRAGTEEQPGYMDVTAGYDLAVCELESQDHWPEEESAEETKGGEEERHLVD